jgi:hypothetical protein
MYSTKLASLKRACRDSNAAGAWQRCRLQYVVRPLREPVKLQQLLARGAPRVTADSLFICFPHETFCQPDPLRPYEKKCNITNACISNVLTDSTVVSLGTVGDRKLDQRLVCRSVLCIWFKSRLDSLWIFHRFPQPLKLKAKLGHRIQHDGFLTNPYQLFIHQWSYHRCYETGATISVLK